LSTILTSVLIFICIWLFSFVAIVAINQHITIAQSADLNFVPYSNPTFGIRTEYPADWGRLDLSFLLNDSADIDFYPLDDTSGSKHVRIQVETILPAQNLTFERYSDAEINSVEGQIVESNSTILAGLPAHEIVFTNVGLKTLQVWTIKDNRAYTIIYVAEEEDFEDDLPVAKRMKESFQII
jgi:eukaryotic-like serine/threonine-protein kinase